MFDYFYGQQAEQFSFYRIPKILFTGIEFQMLSIEAKLLYGILLDRMNYSARNGWFDENNRVYIIFTLEDVMENLNCAKQKAVKLLNELENECGLIERKRQGLGKPNLIYVKNFIKHGQCNDIQITEGNSHFKKYENQTSKGMLEEHHEVLNSNGTNTKNKKINNSDINNLSFYPIKKALVKEDRVICQTKFEEQLDTESLFIKFPYHKQMIKEILDLLVDTYCSTKHYVRIGGEDKPIEVVKDVFQKLEFKHIEYVMDCLLENTTKVKNMRQYLLTTLYNAPMTIDNYYNALVQHDMNGNREE